MNSNLSKIVTYVAIIAISALGILSVVAAPEANAGHWNRKNHYGYKHHYSNKMMNNYMAPVQKTIVQTAIDTPSLSTLVGAVKAANLVDTLNSAGPFTVFAPDNDAFAKITVPSDVNVLSGVLTYHVVKGLYPACKLHNGQVLTTVNGQTLTVIKKDGTVKLKSASGNIVTVKTADIKTSNGIVHVIDNVLLPK